jgi:hypothetical protein
MPLPWTAPALAPVPVAEAEDDAEEPSPMVQTAPPAPAGPWTVGAGSRRRLTEAGLGRVADMMAEGKTTSQIAAEMGITRRAVQMRRQNGTESAATWAATPQPERDLARAEKNREYQREWYRKKRAKPGTPAAAEPVVVGVDLSSGPDVQVEAEVTVPALILPPPPPAIVLPAPAAPAKLILPPPAKPKAEPQVITTTPKEVRAWLIASMKAGGLSLVQAQDRVAYMTHDQALAEANQRRARVGHPPFAFLGARSVA